MELKNFVAEALKQIVDGVIIAQEYGRTKGARINPLHLPVRNAEGKSHSVTFRSDIPHDIEFDVAVTTTTGSGTSGGVGVFVGPVGVGSKGQTTKANESISRIKFTIPVVLPSEKEV